MSDEYLDEGGRGALHYAARDGDLAEISALLKSGENVNLADDDGRTPLHFAALEQKGQAAYLLLSAGASCDAIDRDGNTPLMNAVFTYQNDAECIEVLRRAGANVHCRNNYGQTPLGLARLIANTDVGKHFEALPGAATGLP